MAHRLIKGGELVLYGPVGWPVWFEDGEGFTANEVVSALSELSGDVTVRLNSGGGVALDGIAIYNALAARATKVTVIIDAIAASAASAIAMAGDEIVMRDGALMMIHDASGLTVGTASDHEKQAEVLGKLDGELARIYARRTGKAVSAIRALMDEETWLDGPEAVEAGFATHAGEEEAAEPAAFAYRVYAHAPERLVALADRRGWINRTAAAFSPAAPASHHRRTEDNPMPDDANKGGAAGAGSGGAAAAAADANLAAVTARAEAAEAELAALKTQTTADAIAATASAHAEIATLCANAGVPAMAGALIREGVAPKDAQARIDGAKDIKAAVELARKRCPEIEAALADRFIAAGASIETVRADLFARIAQAEEAGEIQARSPGDGAARAQGKGEPAKVDTGAIWAKWNRRGEPKAA